LVDFVSPVLLARKDEGKVATFHAEVTLVQYLDIALENASLSVPSIPLKAEF
jgi:hypothetical protein